MKRLASMLILILIVGIIGLAFIKYGSIENAVNELINLFMTIWSYIIDCFKHIVEYVIEVFNNLMT